MSAGFLLLQRFMREETGLAVDPAKRYLLDDRLAPILRDAKLDSLEKLGPLLFGHSSSELAQRVAEALTINETSFFRDPPLFAALRQSVLPDLIRTRSERRRLRFWCAGCSSGQEVYSLAMALEDVMRQRHDWTVEILGTDLSRPMIEAARAGRYSQFEVQRGLSISLLIRHFKQIDTAWQVNAALRAKVDFGVHNLAAPSSDLGRFDIVFCRNVLYYFDPAMRRHVLAKLAASLEPDGLVVLGAAERGADDVSTVFSESESPFAFRLKSPRYRGAPPAHPSGGTVV